MVARVRRLAGQRRVGHAGTLDPLAEGVLPVLLGRATRLADAVQSGRKTYVAEITLGTATETDDSEGSAIAHAPVPALSRALVEATLERFNGDIMQTPPKYSALKIDGRRAYVLARAGAEMTLSPRPVTIDSIRLLGLSEATLTIEVSCSRGTYIRALARDIAECLQTVGHMSALTRTRVGPFLLESAIRLDDLAGQDLSQVLLPASRAIPDAPAHTAAADAARKFTSGQSISAPAGLHADRVWVYDPGEHLIGLAAVDGSLLRPRLVL